MDRSSRRSVLSVVLLCFLSSVHADEWTASLPISKINFDGSLSGTIYFQTPSGNWSVAGCPNTQFVLVRDIPGVKEILAIGMTAKLSDRNVAFSGTCYSPGYFRASYISME
jgi:hypothetical protein